MSNGTSLANPSNAGKDTIYVDIDDEITTIIDKVRSSHQKIVALVLPKRATMLQSIVNMKLLKRTADDAKKHLVLITAEPSLLPLAANVGLYVAKNLQSRPEIPEVPQNGQAPDDTEEALSMDDDQPSGAQLDAAKPIGDLAMGSIPPSSVDDTIDLDNGDTGISGSAPKAVVGGNTPKKSKNGNNGNKFKVPNFNRFRMLLILGIVGIVVLIGAWILCFTVLPKATITVKTNASNVPANLTLTLSTAANSVNEASDTVPAQIQQQQKSYSQQAPATGQKDNGTKASGAVTMVAKICGTIAQPSSVPAGTGVSANGLTFVTQQNTSFSNNGDVNGGCITYKALGPTGVTAQNNGSQYNIGSATFTVAGRSDVSATSSNTMTGGTSNIVKIVAQSDIDGAKQKITSQDTAAIKQQLVSAFQNVGLYAVQSSFQAGDPKITTTANAGDQADNVTVNATITYTMFGAKQTDIHQLIASTVNKKIDTSKQVILDDGLSGATFNVQTQDGAKAVVALQDTAVAGPDLKIDKLKPQVAGKKANDAANIIKANPGVTDVNVSYSPFWVSAIPKNTSKISIVIEKPTQTQK
ncbi:MAG TPA: hypothetical protein VJR27_01055 [Candidatus Saccharimonadales bacterium]|nr:hypothetical protein [Candidatus Saccharimonadales bacterium]